MTSVTRVPHGRRILIIDDNVSIHDDFRKVLAATDRATPDFDELEAALFEVVPETTGQREFDLVSAYQGKAAYDEVVAANAAGQPFSLAFVDMRMPPGWDGLETIEHLWQADPHLQIVICSAYSDHSWADLRTRLGERDALLILKKPFDPIAVVQCAHALTAKWGLARESRMHLDELEHAVRARTSELVSSNARLAEELVHRDRMEAELRLAHRLEAMGQLAAGIAHEINTPIQYVGDNLSFVRDGATAMIAMTDQIRGAIAAYAAGGSPLSIAIEAAVEAADLGYLTERVPGALEAMGTGIARVSSIVRAMKELAHPGPRDASQTDINRALGNALEVTGAAYRYVADVAVDLGPLPPVVCFPDELNQVFLNLIINASHAMEDRDLSRRGTLGIRTRVDGDDVVISISDSGCGIQEANRDRIFDAFFTTKSVGRGTGQGLAIARTIIVDRHQGALTFDTTVGRGTTFHVRIPIAGPCVRVAQVA